MLNAWLGDCTALPGALASERGKMDCDLVLSFDNCVNPEHAFISLNSHLYNGAQNQLNLIERMFERLI